MFRSFTSRDREFMCKLYNTYILPTIDFGIQLYWPYRVKDIDSLEYIQKKFTKRLFRSGLCPSYTERLRILNMESIEARTIRASLKMAFRIFNNQLQLSILRFSPAVRDPNRIFIKSVNSNILRNSFSHRVSTIWNQLTETHKHNHSTFSFLSFLCNCKLDVFLKGTFIR